MTLASSGRAAAPDRRTFREIIDAEGFARLKAAQVAQLENRWMR